MFTFSPALDTALSRVRFAVGDITDPGLFEDAIYTAVLLACGDDERRAIRSVAAALAAWAATQPDRIASDGSSLSWSERISQWNKIALGQAGTTRPGTPFSAADLTLFTLASGRRGR